MMAMMLNGREQWTVNRDQVNRDWGLGTRD